MVFPFFFCLFVLGKDRTFHPLLHSLKVWAGAEGGIQKCNPGLSRGWQRLNALVHHPGSALGEAGVRDQTEVCPIRDLEIVTAKLTACFLAEPP